jgi:hypothetical protein
MAQQLPPNVVPPGAQLPQLPPPPVLPLPQVPGAAAPLQVPVLHKTFASYYSDESKDPLNNRVAGVLARFDVDAAAIQQGSDLLQVTIANVTVPNTFLFCASLHAQGPVKIYLLHALSRYPQTLDGTVTPWDNQIFCYLGDIVQGNVMTVTVPAGALDVVNHTRVYDDDVFAVEITQLPTEGLFPRLPANAAGIQVLRSRYLMRLPTRYAPMFLSSKGYYPKKAYVSLVEAFTNDNFLQGGATILNWLRLSLHATRADYTGPPVTALTLVAPFMDEDLARHRNQILESLLPDRATPTGGLEAALSQFANAVVTQTTEDRNARLARDLEREMPTTPAAKFGLLLDSLKNLLSVAEEADLPKFWFQFSAAKKKQEFSVLREFLESYARSDQAFVSLAPIVTPKLHSDLSTVTFLADHQDDLKMGLQPFCVVDGSVEYRTSATELSRSFGLLYEREFGVSFNDLNHFKVPKEFRSYPLNYFDLEQNLGIFGNLLGAILGANHPLMTNYRTFWTALTKQYRLRIRQYIDNPRTSTKPVHVLCSVQMICFDWFEAKRSMVTPDMPIFVGILRNLSLGTVSIPLISALKGTLQGVSRRNPGRSRPRELGRSGLTRQPYERTRQPEG